MTYPDQVAGCILGGAIGDAYGSSYEQAAAQPAVNTYYPFGRPAAKPFWAITDDTQLTLATCEAIVEAGSVKPEVIARRFLTYFQARKLTGLGAGTLGALRELAAGGHWSQTGRKGESGAGNGAAMRIAPLALVPGSVARSTVEDVCRITHQHPEAYVGALAVFLSIRAGLDTAGPSLPELLPFIIDQLPDTLVRDRLLELRAAGSWSLPELAARFGSSGYVVDSVPLALVAASRAEQLGFVGMLQELVQAGGDTDTNCSLAGQIAGTWLGTTGLPPQLLAQLQQLPDYPWMQRSVAQFAGAELL
ncbi:ADP-ribosylglycohydrolase family protein [Hymenobacter chitinivorans]|uniref:ADP-ribosylglycohydrolase n=1 Tax=Hymenobacter chitinivorans DSM 11115 TaxID=1121954 RepID=A0A2M9BPW2_9BACT|nr:ADP-ribosylglycohydrolase family protein [Hymenobacter chitinivorans]PJJ59995.1 ADP-ribosylglycohydrolase [Hymenobacter chitinivorans DSM 11115]